MFDIKHVLWIQYRIGLNSVKSESQFKRDEGQKGFIINKGIKRYQTRYQMNYYVLFFNI